MARSKRPLSPVAEKHGPKRLRLQSQEVIIIDDGVNIPPQANAEWTDDSDQFMNQVHTGKILRTPFSIIRSCPERFPLNVEQDWAIMCT